MKTKLVAELGCTHLGSLNVAEDMTAACLEAGFAEVKGQVRKEQEEWKNKPRDSGYGSTFWEHQRAIELPWKGHLVLKDQCKAADAEYYVSVWDLDSAAWAGRNFGTIKIAAPLHEWWELYAHAAEDACDTQFIVSIPPVADFRTCIEDICCYPIKRLYSCVPMYPTPLEASPLYYKNDVRLAARQKGMEWGYSLHVAYPEIEVAIVGAVMQGAQAIEFHIAPYNEQRQKGAQMGVPLYHLKTIATLVEETEMMMGNGPNAEFHRVDAEARMKATIEGLRGK